MVSSTAAGAGMRRGSSAISAPSCHSRRSAAIEAAGISAGRRRAPRPGAGCAAALALCRSKVRASVLATAGSVGHAGPEGAGRQLGRATDQLLAAELGEDVVHGGRVRPLLLAPVLDD